MSEAIHTALVLAIPFMFGIVVGIEIVKRRPKSVDALFGGIIKQRVLLVVEQRKWVGDGFEISSVIDLPMPCAPNLQIIVKDPA